MTLRYRDKQRQWTAFVLTALLLAPFITFATPAANAQLFGGRQTNPQKKGMSTGQKVLLVGGAALLYYLYRKHQAKKQAEAPARGATVANNRTPQLYRSKNGGIYYRDAQNKPVWLTVPQQPVQVSQQELQRYAPDYNRYSGPAPSAPQGYRTQQFSQFDPNVFSGAGASATGNPPGPRGRY